MDTKQQPNQQAAVNIGVDPMRTPILYADAIRVTSNENGFVIEVAQGIAGTDQAFVVARIGMSKEHAKKLAELIAKQVLQLGQFATGDVKIVG